jgi:hypothetical protein
MRIMFASCLDVSSGTCGGQCNAISSTAGVVCTVHEYVSPTGTEDDNDSTTFRDTLSRGQHHVPSLGVL